MSDAYVATLYASAAAAQAACNAAASGKLTAVVAFMEGAKQKFMVVVAA